MSLRAEQQKELIQSMLGKRFHRWTVISYSHRDKFRSKFFNCICDCGKTGCVAIHKLRGGKSLSCGCLQKERVAAAAYRHGGALADNRVDWLLYRKFHSARNRCRITSDAAYRNYGGRGIEFHWDKYEDFVADMKESYIEHVERHGFKNTSLERIDNNGHYEAANCTWATKSEQGNNQRRTLLMSYNGKTQSASDWAKEYGIRRNTLYARLYRGMNLEKALNQPVCHKKKIQIL